MLGSGGPMSRNRMACIALVSLVSLAAVATPSRAAATPKDDRAAELFQKSHRAYRDGQFQEAVDLLLEARQLKTEPVLLYDLGRAYEALGKLAEAADAYGHYLEEAP